MPAAIKGIPWDQIKLAYLQGQGTLKELAERFEVNPETVQTHASRNGWRHAKAQIDDGNTRALTRISEKVNEKVAQKSADLVGMHLEKVLLSGNGVLAKLADSLKSLTVPDIKRLDHLEAATRVYEKWDDLVRRAHGLSDPRQGVDITSGGQPIHERSLAIMQSCQKLVAEGQASTVVIDVDSLVSEMEADGKPGKVEPGTDEGMGI